MTKELATLSARGDTEARHKLQELKQPFFVDKAAPFVPEHVLP